MPDAMQPSGSQQPAAVGQQQPAPPAAPSPAPASPPAAPKNDVEEHKLVAALSYIGFLFVVPMLTAKDSPFAQFHVKQGIVLFVVEVILSLIPIIGWLVALALLVVSVYAFFQALQGKQWELPLLGQYAKKIKL